MLTKPFFVCAFQEKILEIRAEQNHDKTEDICAVNSLEGLHFLAAEDNEINAEILREILSMEGADCELVENGQLAVACFANAAEKEFDAILMDVQMPVMNGYDAAKAIRELDRADKDIPIIAMTADAFSEDIKKCLECGMNAHVAKPIDIKEVTRILLKYIE